jgi:hypothetical protein
MAATRRSKARRNVPSSKNPLTWSDAERGILEEARSNLKRKNRNSAIWAIVGSGITIATLAFGAGFVVIAYGPMIFGALNVYQTSKAMKRLDHLSPGTPLNEATLGIRTSADPPKRSQKRAAIVVASMTAAVVIAIVVMWMMWG